jgi:2-methylfumaryl-CoA hydratase
MKTNPGRFFEDYRVGEVIVHAVPRTLSGGERAMYHALYPARGAIFRRMSLPAPVGCLPARWMT